jgi:magnesium-transporting ATPase (P-type)
LFTLPLWVWHLTFFYVMCLLFLLLFLFTYYYFLYIRPKLATAHPTNEVRMLDKKMKILNQLTRIWLQMDWH